MKTPEDLDTTASCPCGEGVGYLYAHDNVLENENTTGVVDCWGYLCDVCCGHFATGDCIDVNAEIAREFYVD
tara:strand:- start:265 stop:480 length:216 start_codon:yes stop_codon:yes gene_type:complete